VGRVKDSYREHRAGVRDGRKASDFIVVIIIKKADGPMLSIVDDLIMDVSPARWVWWISMPSEQEQRCE
jgi:hypothetical protein